MGSDLPACQIYKEEMKSIFPGSDALWEPIAAGGMHVRIGDVGFIDDGQFHLLFHAGSPVPRERLGIDVPKSFVPLTINGTSFRVPRKAGRLSSRHVQEIEVKASTTGTSESHPLFSLKLTGKRGAALVTRYPTYIEDAKFKDKFREYANLHYGSWAEFAYEAGHGRHIRPFLVYGIDMTKDFAMTAYSKGSASLETDLVIDLPVIAASASIRATQRASHSVHSHQWPIEWSEQVLSIPPEQMEPPGGFDYCVFIRYYTKTTKGGWWRNVFQSSSEVESTTNLFSVDSRGGTLPGPPPQPDATSGDGGLGGDWVDIPGDTTHYAPNGVGGDDLDVVAEYIYQNSDAVSALMHHEDLAAIRMVGETDDISTLLAKRRPHIVVDSDGVGRIDHQRVQQQGLVATTALTPTTKVEQRKRKRRLTRGAPFHGLAYVQPILTPSLLRPSNTTDSNHQPVYGPVVLGIMYERHPITFRAMGTLLWDAPGDRPPMQSLVENYLREAFEASDKDDDGRISIVNLKKAFSTIGGSLDNEEIDRLVKAADPDQTGRISSEEFLQVLKF